MTDVPIPEIPPPDPSGSGRLHRIQPLLAIVIALVAIGLAAWEGLENRRHNRMVVQPRIGVEVGSGRDEEGEYGTMAIVSTGLGPAVVTSFRVYWDGRPLVVPAESNNPWAEVIGEIAADSLWTDVRVHTHAYGKGYFLRPGISSILFEARGPTRPAGAPALADVLERIAVDICYCSIYGSDCDRALVATRDVEVAACPGPEGGT